MDGWTKWEGKYANGNPEAEDGATKYQINEMKYKGKNFGIPLTTAIIITRSSQCDSFASWTAMLSCPEASWACQNRKSKIRFMSKDGQDSDQCNTHATGKKSNLHFP